MFNPNNYKSQKTRALPIVLLLDTSGSMMEPKTKIDSLNMAVSEMIDSLNSLKEEDIVVSIITFGGEVECLYNPPFRKVQDIQWTELQADGFTPMGTALQMAKAMIDDKDTTKGSWYRPTTVLVSDGQPNDEWEKPLDDFVNEGRSSKTHRMAMAIGADADENVLKRFLAGSKHPLFYAHNAKDIHSFFERVTMSVTMRAKSPTKDEMPEAEPLDPRNTRKDSPDDFG